MASGSTQALKELVSGVSSVGGGQRRPVRRADNFTTFMYRLSEQPGNLNFLEPSGPI